MTIFFCIYFITFTFFTNLSGKSTQLTVDGTKTTEGVVLTLLQGLEHKGHHVYMDNYYSSPTLCKKLKENGFGACGTVRVDRQKMPEEWKQGRSGKKRQENMISKGEVRSVDLEDGLVALQWKDKRLVTMISTIHDNEMISKRRRTRRVDDGTEEILKPKMIDEYNTYMGGVDKSDQLLSYYGFNHRTIKWWKRAAFHLLDLAIVNAYILYRQSQQDKYLTHEQFRLKLAKQLLLTSGIDTTMNPGSSLSQRRTSLPPQARLTERHFPSKLPKQLDCCVCSDRKKKRKCTSYCCEKCDVALCVVPCFELYHTKVDPQRYI